MFDGRRTLLLFSRSPEAEARAKNLSPAKAAELFAALCGSWAHAACRTGARLVVATPRHCRKSLEANPAVWGADFLMQKGSNLGERLARAARDAVAAGAQTLLIAAGDCPAPGTEELDGAFRALESSPGTAVLGPSRDGGFYLIGLPCEKIDLLQSIYPRQRDAFRQCREMLTAAGYEVSILSEIADLDSIRDLQRFSRFGDHRWQPYRHLIVRALAPRRPLPSKFALPGVSPVFSPSGPRAPPSACR